MEAAEETGPSPRGAEEANAGEPRDAVHDGEVVPGVRARGAEDAAPSASRSPRRLLRQPTRRRRGDAETTRHTGSPRVRPELRLCSQQRYRWMGQARRFDVPFAFALAQSDEERRHHLLLSWAAERDVTLLEKPEEHEAIALLLEESRERLLCELVASFAALREKESQRVFDVHAAAMHVNSEFHELLSQREAQPW